jgi:glucose-1-phosphate cytidylyltransferase
MNKLPDIPLMILCGGKGTRLRDVTEILPKPMVAIGEQPIVWHIMKSFAAFGIRRFILCLGYKREVFVDYFMNYHLRTSDATIRLGHNPDITFHGESEESNWEVTLAGTGLESMTGCRVFRAARYLRESDENFFLTYGDGVSDVNIAELYQTHLEGGKMVTVTAVHPEARFGQMLLDGSRVSGFEEKPPRGDGYINGGFMVIRKEFIKRYLNGQEDQFFEREPMTRCAADGQMQVFKHKGFWQCMDNQREYNMLNAMWERGNAPWTKYWK